MSKKHVVFVLSGYGKLLRGAEQFVANLAVQLETRYDISVLGGGPNAPHAVPLRFPDRSNRLAVAANRTPGLGHFLRLFQLDPLNWEWFFCARAAKKWLLSHPCDLLVTEGARWGGLLGRWAHRRWGIPVVDVAHGAPSRWEIAAARARPQAYVGLTRAATDAIAEKVPGLSTCVIPIGIDLDRFSPDGPCENPSLEHPIALAVGALEPLKGMATLIRAVATRPNGSLVILGRGPQHDELAALGARLLGPNRFLLSSAPADAMPRWYRAADVFLSASASEAFALTFLEALACGLPIVTLDEVFRREQLQNHAILLPMPATPDDFARGMTTALESADATRADRLAFSSRYDMSRMASAYATLFDTLMAAYPRA